VAARKREREAGPIGALDLRGEDQLELTTSRRHVIEFRLLKGSVIDCPQLDKGGGGRATFGAGVLLGEAGAKAALVEAKLTGDGRDGVVLDQGRGLQPELFGDTARAAAAVAPGVERGTDAGEIIACGRSGHCEASFGR